MEKSWNVFASLIRDERGAIGVTFAAIFGFLLAGTLIVVDTARYNVAQARVQTALDTAVISAGRRLGDVAYTSTGAGFEPGQEWQDDAKRYFNANLPSKFLGLEINPEDLKIEYQEDRVDSGGNASSTGVFLAAQRLNMSVQGDLPLFSTGYVKQTSWDVGASNWALRRVRNDLELVLALDNTGSMSGKVSTSGLAGFDDSSDRIGVLRYSAKKLINTVMAADAAAGQTDGKTGGAYIGLVPFTDSVNAGGIPSAANWLYYPTSPTNYIRNYVDSGLWSGCIVEPDPVGADWSASKPLPAALLPDGKFKPMLSTYSFEYTPSKLGKNDYLVKSSDADGFQFNPPTGRRDVDRRLSAQPGKAWNAGDDIANVPRTFFLNFGAEPSSCTVSRTVFLTKAENSANLTTAVDAMRANGATAVPTGLLWAWRMVSPSWQGKWGGTGLPRDADPKLRKVIVLLSDGKNEPTVDRKSDGSVTGLAQLAYSYRTCTTSKNNKCTKWGATKTATDNVNQKISTFPQCPIMGLRSVDPLKITPDSFDAACDAKSTGGVNSTAIGYNKGSSESGRGNLTSTAINGYMQDLCQNIHADPANIIVYTLLLGNDANDTDPSSIAGIMKSCASDPNNYFGLSDAGDLPNAFAQIAGALTELRLTPNPQP